MPSTLTALFATAIHEARIAEADPTGLSRAATLLVTAAGARRVEWRVSGRQLEVNGTPITGDSPGAGLIVEAFRTHGTAALALPAALGAAQWSDIASIYAAGRGLYPTPDHLRAAVVGVVPGATVTTSATGVAEDPELAAALREIPDMSRFAEAIQPEERSVVSREAERSEFSGLLDPLLREGRAAVAAFDWERVAQVLLGLAELADRGDEGSRTIIVRERRRCIPESALQHLVRAYPSAGPGSRVARAIDTLGPDGAEAVLELLAARPDRAQQRHYLDLLATIRGAEQPLVRALGSHRDHLVRDAAEAIGRRRMTDAVPVLGSLLRHGNEAVRTAAWRALESIGTDEAIRLIG